MLDYEIIVLPYIDANHFGCHVVNFPDWLALLRLLARFFILSQSGLFFVARTIFNRYECNCGEECSVVRSSRSRSSSS